MISVCIATYNGEKYIKEQIDSIIFQISDIDEIIVSDDGSTDMTLEILRNYNDHKIKIILNDKNKKGFIHNFENALNKANGEYIFLCDQDDVWLPNKVSMILSELETVDLVYTNALMVDEKLRELGILYTKPNIGFFPNLKKNNFVGATMAFRRQLLYKALPFPDKIPAHDHWLGLVAELYGKTSFIPEPLILYRRHPLNVSQTGKKSTSSLTQKIKWRINIIFALLMRYLKSKTLKHAL